MHAGAKITVGGQHIANWLIGQVRDHSVSEADVRALARQIEEDEDKLVEAFYKVPQMDADTFEKIARSLYHIANQMSNSAYQNEIFRIQPRLAGPCVSTGNFRVVKADRIWSVNHWRAVHFVMAKEHRFCLDRIGPKLDIVG